MHKSKARKESLRLRREQRAQRKAENRLRQAILQRRLRAESRAERLMHSAWISAFILGFLVWTERLSSPLGGAVQLLLLTVNALLIYTAYHLPRRMQTEAVWCLEYILAFETLVLIFLRQPSRFICIEPHLPMPAVILWLALCASLAPLIHRLHSKIKLLLHVLALAALLFAFSLLWTEAINTTLDFHPAQEVAAESIDRRKGTSGRGAAYYQIKLAFPQSDGSRTTHWFDVTHTQYFEKSFSLLRHPGALGFVWYELSP